MKNKYYKVTLANDYAYIKLKEKNIPIMAYQNETGIYEAITKEKLSLDNKHLKYESLIEVDDMDEEVFLFVTLSDEEIQEYKKRIRLLKMKQDFYDMDNYCLSGTFHKKLKKK